MTLLALSGETGCLGSGGASLNCFMNSTFAPSAHTHVAADITNPLFLSVGDSVRVGGHQVFVQSTAPVSGMVTNDLWFW